MKPVVLVVFFLLVSTPLWADENSQVNEEVNSTSSALPASEPLPAEKTASPASIPIPEPPQAYQSAWAQKYAEQPYIALVNDYETTIKPDWSYEETYHARVKIQREEGKDLGQWPVYYNKSRDSITDIQAHVEGPDGHQYPATDIKDLPVLEDSPLYGDIRMKLVTFPKISVGSIIEVTVKSVTVHKEIPDQFWGEILYPAIPTQRAQHTFIIPDDKLVQLKSYKNDYKPLVEKGDGKTKYTFNFKETNPISADEELMPPLQEVLGAIYLSSMNDWKQVADWYRDLVHKNTVDDANITVKALELTKDKTTQKDKARAILEFLQDNFRYLNLNFGDNTVEPHATNEIFKARYADSKDISLLAKQMLKLAGIDSNVCLFSAEFTGNPQNGLPSPSVFTSVILQISLDNQDYYVDPILKGFDFGHYPSAYDNAYVLVIDEQGYKFDNLPIASEDDHVLKSQAEISVNPDGSAEYRVHVNLPLEASQNFKNSWVTSSEEDKNKFFTNLEQNFAKGGKLVDRKVIGIEDRYTPVEFDLRYQALGAYPLVNDMILIKEEDQSDMPDFVSADRKNMVFVPNNSLIKNINIYHVPEGFKIGTVPSNYSLSIDLMEVSVNYLQKEGVVEIDSAYHTKRSSIPIERYNEVKEFRKELAKKNDQYVIFKKTSNLSPESKDWIKSQ